MITAAAIIARLETALMGSDDPAWALDAMQREFEQIKQEFMQENENFANAPQSVTELRSNRTEDGSKWLPRDALIALLRAIDAGQYPGLDALVIAYRVKLDTGATQSFFFQACPDYHTALGVLEGAKFRMQTS